MGDTWFISAADASREALRRTVEDCSNEVHEAGKRMIQALKKGHPIFICGNGGSAASAQHFAAELVGHYEKERKALPAMALHTDSSTMTAIANDDGYEQVFSRQLRAFAKPDDLLVVLTTSGKSPNILAALDCARDLGLTAIALTSEKGAQLQERADIAIMVPSSSTPRIQEVHDVIIHTWCEMIDAAY